MSLILVSLLMSFSIYQERLFSQIYGKYIVSIHLEWKVKATMDRAMTHKEEIYPDPDVFRPERFFDANGNLNDDSRVLAYGFGRR